MYWHYTSLSFTLDNGESVKAGRDDFNASHTFDPTKKITKVEVIINDAEMGIMRINFYHHEEKLVAVGLSVRKWY